MADFDRTPAASPKRLPVILLRVIWICLIVAATQPQWIVGDPVTQATGRSVVLVIDLSRSMEKRDFELDGQRQNRLQAVKAVAGDFLQKRQGDRVGLIMFGDEAFVANPLSFDLTAARYALAESAIGMAGRTTALGDALALALIKLKEDSARDKAVILLTDGTNNAGEADPEHAAQIAAEWGIRVHTIGLGSVSAPGSTRGQNASADLDTATLKSIALLSGGRYYRTRTLDELKEVYATLDKLLTDEQKAPPLIPRRDIRQPFLLIALLASLLLIAHRLLQGARST